MASNTSIKNTFVWNVVQQIGHFGIQFAAMIILARFLFPRDYALIGMINIFISLGNLFVDSGIGGAVVYKQNANDEDYSTMFIFNMVVAGFFYVIMFFLASIVADFYNEESLVWIIRVTMLLVVINGLSIMPCTLLTKKLDFRALAVINIISSIVSLIAAVVMAIYGMRVWALVAQMLVQAISNTALMYIYTRFYPKFVFSIESAKEQLGFGLNTMMANLLRMISDNIFTNFIAKVENTTTTGYYVQASKFHSPFIGVVISVMDRSLFPVFAKINNDKEKLRAKIEYFTSFFVSASILLMPFLLIISPSIILFLLGDKWGGTTIYFNLLLVTTPAYVLQSCVRNALKSAGNTKQILINDIIRFILVCATIAACLHSTIIGILYGIIFIQYLLAVILFIILKRQFSMSIMALVRNWTQDCIIALFAYYILSKIIPDLNNVYLNATLLSIGYIGVIITASCLLKTQMYTLLKKLNK